MALFVGLLVSCNNPSNDLSQIKFENKTYEYDGVEKSILIEGNLPKGITASYENNGVVSVGVYNVKVDLKKGSKVLETKTATLTIVDLRSITFEEGTFPYDGKAHSLSIKGDLSSGISVTYENNEQTEVGVYDVVAQFLDASGVVFASRTSKLTILSGGAMVALPDLTHKNKAEVSAELSQLGLTDVTVEEAFNIKVFKDYFVGYQTHQIGDNVDKNTPVTVYVATRKLPDISQILVEDIKSFFLNAGISESNIVAVPHPTGDPDYVIGYYNANVGDEYTTGSIRYLYNGSQVKLKDLQGLTIPEINQYLHKNDLTATYYKVVDNSKEMDTFNMYLGVEVGQIIDKQTNISIYLYDNDDVNDAVQPFISKYIDISIGNNGIELYNPLDEAINLNDYYLSIFENGALTETHHIALSGTLNAKTAYVIVSDTSSETLKAKADMISEQLIFDGNDTIQLRKASNHTYIDTIYNIGNTIFSLDNEIFIRRDHITRGQRGYNAKEWAGFIPSFLEPIGTHPYEITAFPTFEFKEETFPNFGMTLVKYLSAADGDTVYFQSLHPRDPGPYNGDKRIRFIMVDTPETQKPGVEGDPYAQEASNFTKNALSTASQIYIQSDRGVGVVDGYGRNLGVVWYNSGSVENPEWHLLNYELVYYGLGDAMGFKDSETYMLSNTWGNRYLYQWVQDADMHARDNQLGIYSGIYKP